MSILKSIVEKFTYLWEIKNPQYCTLAMGEFFESPKFNVPQFWNTEWYLKVYPRGQNENSKDKTSCFISRGQDSGPDDVELKYTISVNSGKQTYSSKYTFPKNMGWGYPTFLPQPLDTYEKSVLILWEMHCELDNMGTIEQRLSSSSNALPYPIKCCAQTKFLHEKKSFQKHIDSLINGTFSKISIPLYIQERYPSLTIDLQNDSGEVIDINVGLADGAFQESLMVICEMRVENNVGQLLHAFKENHTFAARQNETWCLTEKINKSHFQTHLSDSSFNSINLKGDFVFSIGQFHSVIVNVERLNLPKFCVSNNQYVISNEMFLLYKDKKLCDFSLKVGQDMLDVHKAVLGAASPVFAAMFSNDMVEKQKNVVDIKDLEKETVEDMVSFMYTGSVKKLQYESAKKLFVAADKYEISILLDLVRSAIVCFLDSDTICEILSIADSHKDEKLEKEALKFFKLNKSAILSSLKWATFEKENASLAAKSLRQVCLLNKRKLP